MKKIKYFIFINLFFMTFSSFLLAEKMCIAHDSIIQQKKRYISQGLLSLLVQDKMLFAWPVKKCECWISSLYGKRGSGFHHGVDLAAIKGTHVFAAADGYIEKIEKSRSVKGYGNMILINHDDRYKTRYAHLHSIEKHLEHQFSDGKKVHVNKGQKIGTVGSTGHVISKNSFSDPSHLHFEVYKGDIRIDPLIYLFASEMMVQKQKR